MSDPQEAATPLPTEPGEQKQVAEPLYRIDPMPEGVITATGSVAYGGVFQAGYQNYRFTTTGHVISWRAP